MFPHQNSSVSAYEWFIGSVSDYDNDRSDNAIKKIMMILRDAEPVPEVSYPDPCSFYQLVTHK